jgi:hypothetical protein
MPVGHRFEVCVVHNIADVVRVLNGMEALILSAAHAQNEVARAIRVLQTLQPVLRRLIELQNVAQDIDERDAGR